ncbi:MAG: outer membrane lipoprotein LolB [Lautropia sp.]|nr:outer membrane lipoprotein LolB [Lautropia sp.]
MPFFHHPIPSSRPSQQHARHHTVRSLALPLLLTGALLSAGCSTTPNMPADQPGAAIDTQRPLHLSGRFSLSYTEALPEPKSEHNSGRFTLNRDGDDLGIELFSPFGQTIVRAAQRRGEAAWLETAQRQRLSGPTLQDTLERAIGIPVPADRLPYWLSDEFQTVLERSPDGQRIHARENDWRIERDGRRWFLVWHQSGRRLEIRLVLDTVRNPTPDATGNPTTRPAGGENSSLPPPLSPMRRSASYHSPEPATFLRPPCPPIRPDDPSSACPPLPS